MNTKKIAAYGSWISPITSSCITSEAISLDEIQLHASGNYWIEKRPQEKGRCVIVRHSSGHNHDILPPAYSARSRVHEYGGGVYCVTDSGLYFVNDSDQNIYFYDFEAEPCAITHHNDHQYADLIYDHTRQRLICVCQDSTNIADEAINTLITIDTSDGNSSILCSGYDFYSNPRLNPQNNKISWLCWNHPNMPWDGTELWVADINTNGTVINEQKVAGSESISIFQPEWSPDGILTYVSDDSGWWNLYRYNAGYINQLTDIEAEFGLPQWVFSQSTYAYINSREILCAPVKNGVANLSILNIDSGSLTSFNSPWNSFSSIHSRDNNHWFIAASENNFPEIIHLHQDTTNTNHIRSSNSLKVDESFYSYGNLLEFPTRNNDTAFAIYYAPINKDYIAPDDELPPLIVLTHGGPTAMSDSSLDIRKQYWTSRGFAVLDVNYSGSTGFGRHYRERLNYNWGIRDAEDCCDAALYLVERGLADPSRLIIKGSSAGGYTVLCALTFHNVFCAGASYYGIGDLELLVKDTHKFESRYLDLLIGPYPESKNIYHQRSPLLHIKNLNCPVIFFQGTDDKVVPKEQAEKMFYALKDKGIPVAYVAFDGEQHGFRQSETIKKALDAELYFYVKLFALPMDDTKEITIENLGSQD